VHKTTPQFRDRFASLPNSVQQLARKNFELLKVNQMHPSLRFKKVSEYWSVRVSRNYRALAIEDGCDFIWVWIGHHDEYDKITK
jgi:hypothetical protein